MLDTDWKARKGYRHICANCGDQFSRAWSLRRHIAICGSIPTQRPSISQIELEQRVQELTRRVNELSSSSNATTVVNATTTVNNNSINNNNNSVTINAFGSESLAHITPEFIDRCVRRTNKGIVELIEKIHFDPDTPGNSNVRATNVKLPLVKYNDGARWKWARKDNLLDAIVDRGHGMMQDHFDDNEDDIRDMSDAMFDHIRKWMDCMQEKDKRTWENVITDIYVLILNATSADNDGGLVVAP
jgi:hypothetical protein